MSIIITWLLSLLNNPQVLLGLGAIGGVLFIFFKGKSSGENAIEQEVQQATQALNNEIIKTENANQKVESNKNENIQNIDGVNDAAELSRMLNSLTSKTTSDSSDKK